MAPRIAFGRAVAASLWAALSRVLAVAACTHPLVDNVVVATDLNAETSELPRAHAHMIVQKQGVAAHAMAVAPDGSIYLVGTTQVPGPPYRVRVRAPGETHEIETFVSKGWVAHYSAAGAELWQRVVDLGNGVNEAVFRDVAVRPDGTACAIQHNFLTDNNGGLHCFSLHGETTIQRELGLPRPVVLAALSDGSFVTAGSQVLTWFQGRPHTAAWIGRIRDDRVSWEATQLGEFSSRSAVVCLAHSADGKIIAGGRIGRRHGGPASRPWLASWDARGNLLWSETMQLFAWRDQEVRALAVSAEGDVLAAGLDGSAWVRRYDARGRLRAVHQFGAREHLASLVAVRDGYVVHGGTSLEPYDPARGPFTAAWIQAYSNAGQRLWLASAPKGCAPIGRLQRGAANELIAMYDCKWACCIRNGFTRCPNHPRPCGEVQVVAYRSPDLGSSTRRD